jgi:hypothetical protein
MQYFEVVAHFGKKEFFHGTDFSVVHMPEHNRAV